VTPERWAQVKSVVADALETPKEARAAFLDRACGGDAELRGEVDSLLAASEGEDSLPDARRALASAAHAVVSDRESALRTFLEHALGHQYDILRPLGRGGMGAVYLARERALERVVAIKVLSPDLAAAPESRERFRREARIAAQLSHPGILPLYTFGEVGDLWYFVMGYVRGESLADRLRLEGRVPWTEAHRVLTDLVDAVECAHRHGVVHRDIKPANILMDEESGHAMLADFGISKTRGFGDSLTATGVVVGTPDYMSPEQALGAGDVDERTDIYSLGAVGYRMLAGREPLDDVSSTSLSARRFASDPPPLQSIAPTVPDGLAAVIMKCLARDRADRWPDARTLKEALSRAGAIANETLPEAVRDLPSFGAYALLWAVAWTVVAFMPLRPPSERALLLLIALLVPVGLMLHVWNVGRHGLGLADLARVAAWPPEWWSMWWPRVLRRPNDLWARLPFAARLARSALSAFFLVIPSLVVIRQWYASDGGRLADWIVVAQVAAIAIVAASLSGALRWTRRQGLHTPEAIRLLLGATTASAFWNTTKIARLLAPATGRIRPPERDSPTDHRRAIAELQRLMPASASEAAGASVVMADRVLRAIEERELEIASLMRDASVGELDRLTAQLAALGAPSAQERAEQRELRELVKHQRELVHRMRGRIEIAARDRAQLFDLLRGLWTQLCVLSDAPASDAGAGARATESVRAICSEISDVLTEPASSTYAPSRSGRNHPARDT
jgi:serine/threonine protein kinase